MLSLVINVPLQSSSDNLVYHQQHHLQVINIKYCIIGNKDGKIYIYVPITSKDFTILFQMAFHFEQHTDNRKRYLSNLLV